MRDDFDILPECGALALLAFFGSLFFINPEWGTMMKMFVMVTPAVTIYLIPAICSAIAERLDN
tara:strand:- start:323 stop:511 length:189 start_codon:yes stop_codon:yes gene_type:complete